MLSINDMEVDDLYFEVNVFSREDWARFAITQSLVDSARGWINMADIYAYAKQVMRELSGVAVDIPYNINVLYATAQINKKKRKLADSTLAQSKFFNDDDLAGALMKHLNSNDEDRKLIHKVWTKEVERDKILRRSFVGARVILFPSMRDIAALLYKRPSLEPLLGYDITIFNGTADELGELVEYNEAVNEYNNKLPLLLPFAVAIDESKFPELSRLIFVARRDGKIIGYCGCVLLPFPIEVAPQFTQAINDAMNEFSPVNPPELRILERYFTGVQPRNIYEIEGLSASPFETGNNVGLALVYEALRFIRDPVMMRLYPVSHVVSNAASYITKRILVANFHFHYHGSNHFMNEGFVEILAEDSKRKLVAALTEEVSYYRDFMKSWGFGNQFPRTKKEDLSPRVKLMLNNVIKLYQLYYLMLKWDRPSPSFTAKNNTTLAKLLDLFRLLTKVLPANAIGKYFRVAAENLESYINDVTIPASLVRIDATIIWDDGTPQGYYDKKEKEYPIPLEYGFMVKLKNVGRANTKRKQKYPYVEGYDIIYGVLPNIIDIGDALVDNLDIRERIGNIVLKPINDLVHKDLVKRVDYELPTDQLVGIDKALSLIIHNKSMSAQNATLEVTQKQVQEMMAFIDKNANFSVKFAGLYGIVKGSFDCFLPFKLLNSEWVTNEKNVLAKFVIRPPVSKQQQQPLILLCNNVTIPLPTTREHLFEQLNALYEIIWPNVDREALEVSFNGCSYTIATLRSHFNRLRSMENTIGVVIEIIDTSEEESVDILLEMEVEGIQVGYKLEDFIDEEEEQLEGMMTENVLNKALI